MANILIAGGSGFIGTHLAKHLKAIGHQLTLLTRQKILAAPNYEQILNWQDLSKHSPQEFDTIINLCGHNIAKDRWTEATKKILLDSRLIPTQRLVSFIGKAPTTLLNASAIGFYPFSSLPQSENDYQDTRKACDHFSRQLVLHWEQIIQQASLSTAHILRFGVVLGQNGGLLKQMMLPAKLGLSAVLGHGEQYFSWIHIVDLCRAVAFIVDGNVKACAINLVAPDPLSQKDFAFALAKQLKRPCFLRFPERLVTFLFGQMGEELMLGSQRIYPQQLIDSDFVFNYPTLDRALQDIIIRPRTSRGT